MKISMKARKYLLYGIIVLVISGNVWGLQFNTQTTENAAFESTSSHNLERIHADEYNTPTICYAIVSNWPEAPEVYVDLTEEEVAMFPPLQTALQTFEGSNQTEARYKTTETEAEKIFSYLTTKTRDKYDCRACSDMIFKYREEYYNFVIVISAAVPEITIITEGFSMLSVLVLLGTGIGIYFGQRLKKWKHKS